MLEMCHWACFSLRCEALCVPSSALNFSKYASCMLHERVPDFYGGVCPDSNNKGAFCLLKIKSVLNFLTCLTHSTNISLHLSP